MRGGAHNSRLAQAMLSMVSIGYCGKIPVDRLVFKSLDDYAAMHQAADRGFAAETWKWAI
jgi:hypothetical protein